MDFIETAPVSKRAKRCLHEFADDHRLRSPEEMIEFLEASQTRKQNWHLQRKYNLPPTYEVSNLTALMRVRGVGIMTAKEILTWLDLDDLAAKL